MSHTIYAYSLEDSLKWYLGDWAKEENKPEKNEVFFFYNNVLLLLCSVDVLILNSLNLTQYTFNNQPKIVDQFLWLHDEKESRFSAFWPRLREVHWELCMPHGCKEDEYSKWTLVWKYNIIKAITNHVLFS